MTPIHTTARPLVGVAEESRRQQSACQHGAQADSIGRSERFCFHIR